MTQQPAFLNLYVNPVQPTQGRAMRSIDIGTKNMCIMRLVYDADTESTRVTHAAIVDLRNSDGAQTIDVIANNIIERLFHHDMLWIWFEVPGFTNHWKHYITVERQMDHIQAAEEATVVGEGKKQKKPLYRPPIMFAIYGMLRMLTAAVNRPAAFISDTTLLRLLDGGISLETLGNNEVVFLPCVGGKKAGLESLRGNQRKGGNALDIGIDRMEEQGDDQTANWMETLDRPKPLQDANDTYTQGCAQIAEKLAEEDVEKKRAAKPASKKRTHTLAAFSTTKMPKKKKTITMAIELSDDD